VVPGVGARPAGDVEHSARRSRAAVPEDRPELGVRERHLDQTVRGRVLEQPFDEGHRAQSVRA
jgi:hypothetical protein